MRSNEENCRGVCGGTCARSRPKLAKTRSPPRVRRELRPMLRGALWLTLAPQRPPQVLVCATGVEPFAYRSQGAKTLEKALARPSLALLGRHAAIAWGGPTERPSTWPLSAPRPTLRPWLGARLAVAVPSCPGRAAKACEFRRKPHGQSTLRDARNARMPALARPGLFRDRNNFRARSPRFGRTIVGISHAGCAAGRPPGAGRTRSQRERFQ